MQIITGRRMDDRIAFHFMHGGWSWDPEKETQDEGRRRCAVRAAWAEKIAEEIGLTYKWENDFSVGDHAAEYGEVDTDGGPETCQSCTMYDRRGHIVGSVGCVDDATPQYRRVVEADLANDFLRAVLVEGVEP